MAYRRGRKSIRDAYEENFSPMGSREVTFHRVVNIVEKRTPTPLLGFEYDRRVSDDQWYDDPRNYQDSREFQEDGGYPSSDCRYFENDNPSYGNFHRNSPPLRNDGPYAHYPPNRDDLRHQLDSRSSGRGGPYYRNRGRGSAPPLREDHDDYRRREFYPSVRDRSPVRRDIQSASSGSKSSTKSFTPDKEKSYSYQPRHKSSMPPSQTPSSSKEGSPHSSGSSKEKASASVAESEEVVAASMEPKLTPEKDIKARRSEAIKAKALEIEKHYRQDCETFCTVVKMLVDKEPSLDYLLQAPLDKNLEEIKVRCLDSLKQFIKDMNEMIEQPDKSEEATGSKTSK
ncbi:periphilin-1 [Sphaeramia orbicularis]|uniref:Periphilin-1-like n=1 Tax=Sphaeramia orbicularis TaxID=375764 RepID=A0A672ZUG3_9TELE|nr:periphilin-1-like [Sphaeramia orbicularis]